jgi:hypothetical protein
MELMGRTQGDHELKWGKSSLFSLILTNMVYALSYECEKYYFKESIRKLRMPATSS